MRRSGERTRRRTRNRHYLLRRDPAAKVYSRLPKQKGREWRQYYRLVHNFSKAYPYALVAKKLVHEADSTIAADNLKGAKKTGRKDFTAFRPAH